MDNNPSRSLRIIQTDLNSMFGLDIGSYASLWDVDGTVIHN